MEQQLEIREIEPVRVAYMKYCGIATEANHVFPNVFKAIRGKSNGAPFFQYLSLDPVTKTGEIELCMPTEEEPFGNGVEVKELPGMKALCATHFGPYDTLYQTYAAIHQYAMVHHMKLGTPYREVYVKGPGMILKGNPEKYITEIQFPMEEE